DRLEAVPRETPDDYCVAYAIGWLYHSIRDYEKARAAYEKSIELARRAGDIAQEADTRVKLAILYLDCGIPDKALKCLNEFPGLNKKSLDYSAALVVAARALQDLGDLTEAAQRCQKAVDLRLELGAKTLWEAYRMLGEIKLASGDKALTWDGAQRAYAEASKN